jgi:hypothetical protein
LVAWRLSRRFSPSALDRATARISTKGSPSCEIAFTRCMQSCIVGK